jgi:16S rRNA processing protein RimM
MIKEEDVFKIGEITKSHGLKGEVVFIFTDDVFDRVDADYLFCRIDGLFVPFFIEEYRFRSDTSALIKFEDIDSESDCQQIIGSSVYFPYSLSDGKEDSQSPDYFIGFSIIDTNSSLKGKVVEFDDSTENLLFTIETTDGKNYIIPVHEELIESIDQDNKLITMNLPEGICDL